MRSTRHHPGAVQSLSLLVLQNATGSSPEQPVLAVLDSLGCRPPEVPANMPYGPLTSGPVSGGDRGDAVGPESSCAVGDHLKPGT